MKKNNIKRIGYLNKNEKEKLFNFVNDIRKIARDEIVKVKLFGSKITGKFNKESDIDIFILVKKRNRSLYDKFTDISSDYWFKQDVPISPVIYDMYEYKVNKRMHSPFFEEVDKNGVSL